MVKIVCRAKDTDLNLYLHRGRLHRDLDHNGCYCHHHRRSDPSPKVEDQSADSTP
jgi:hypothetical protein